jgi:hypothetical protein
MAFGLQSANANDKRESLLSILKDVSPNTDNYFITNLGTAPAATNTLHQWGVFNTARPTSVTGVIEGAEASYDDLTTPEKSNNYLVLLDETVRISDTQMSISTITGENPLVFQKDRALKRLKAKMEYVTINGDVVARASGVASGMDGFDSMISTNVTFRASGTSFTETELNDMLQESYDQVSMEFIADVLACPMVIKRRIATFTSNLTRNIMAEDKKLSNEIRVYDSTVGQTVKIIPHKDVRKVNVSATLGNALSVYALREDTWKHSFLANGGEPSWVELARDGHRQNGMYKTEFTLVGFAQRASVKRTGYMNSL